LISRSESEGALGNDQSMGDSSMARTNSRIRTKKVPKEKAREIADFEGFVTYVETSSLFGDGVKNVFDEAVHAVLKDQSKYSKDLLANLQTAGTKAKKDGKCLLF